MGFCEPILTPESFGSQRGHRRESQKNSKCVDSYVAAGLKLEEAVWGVREESCQRPVSLIYDAKPHMRTAVLPGHCCCSFA